MMLVEHRRKRERPTSPAELENFDLGEVDVTTLLATPFKPRWVDHIELASATRARPPCAP